MNQQEACARGNQIATGPFSFRLDESDHHFRSASARFTVIHQPVMVGSSFQQTNKDAFSSSLNIIFENGMVKYRFAPAAARPMNAEALMSIFASPKSIAAIVTCFRSLREYQ